ncbi:hypothetical protein AB0K09_23460 [Streptomyces sp. NPDC049577]|uniref:hypothetical protein n=1 Tax=Streptomyces sp. NPDC049577 TaxID=3155153 RepID=UPI00341C6189
MAVRTATPTTGWLTRGKDGRLTAYAPAAGGFTRWTEVRPGGPEWTGPEHFAVPGLDPYLSIARSAEGYVYLTGVRRREVETPDGHKRTETDIVYATQFQPGRSLTPWRSIGTPYGQDWDRAAQVGPPTIVVDSAGPHVFVRNAGGGVCGRRQDARGIWGPWADLKGSHVLETLSAAATAEGRVELLATASEYVLRWRQEEPGGPLRRVLNTPAKPLAGSTSVPVGDGRVAHYWRSAADSALHTQCADAPTGAGSEAGAEAPVPAALGSLATGGTGPVAVLHTTLDDRPCVVLAQRAASGLPAVAAHPADEAVPAGAAWSETGETCAGTPALALDAHDRVVVAAIGADGALRVARQEPGAGLSLGEWRRV